MDYYPGREAERGLSAEGRRDAERVADLLADDGVDVVVSSSYARAVETVRPTAEAVGTEVRIDEGFRERRLADGEVENFDAAIERVCADPTFSWPGGESNVTAQERGVEAVERTLDRWSGKDVVIGTHGNIMTLILSHYDDRYGYEFWRGLTMPDVYRATFGGGGAPRVERIYSDE